MAIERVYTPKFSELNKFLYLAFKLFENKYLKSILRR